MSRVRGTHVRGFCRSSHCFKLSDDLKRRLKTVNPFSDGLVLFISSKCPQSVIPAQAGIHTGRHGKPVGEKGCLSSTIWIPACAGMTVFKQAVACISTNRVRGCTTHPTCGGTGFKTEV
ncbi:hypothetical protein [Neisseria sp. RH3002v2g]|uniref:hypothetical protein n=1 Tax=Neisseria sp. RH3002v2g TaxID=1871109 RepID=UPI0016613793|nr:hypothetical protein [Neisseria sp. RH3002v2g]